MQEFRAAEGLSCDQEDTSSGKNVNYTHNVPLEESEVDVCCPLVAGTYIIKSHLPDGSKRRWRSPTGDKKNMVIVLYGILIPGDQILLR